MEGKGCWEGDDDGGVENSDSNVSIECTGIVCTSSELMAIECSEYYESGCFDECLGVVRLNDAWESRGTVVRC